MSLAAQPYNLTLPSYSPVLTYLPYRDGDAALGWNSSYSGYTVGQAINDDAQVLLGYVHGIGTAYRTTSYAGASVNLNFTGTAVYLCFSTVAPFTFSVDGRQIQATGQLPDDACAGYGAYATQLFVASNLSQSDVHSATLQGSGALNFYGATVTMNAGQPGPKKAEIIDSDDGGWNWAGAWMPETDDAYMWNGRYRATAAYDPSTVASYTFQGASAIVLRGLSMFNYGPYTVTLDGNQSSAFNGSDLWWRHSGTVTYFASGLDPSQSHTIEIANYDANHPNPTPIGFDNAVGVAIDTLSLIMDDTATRDALLSTSPAPAPSSGVSVGTIVAAVLGGLLLLMLALNVLLFILWRRLKKEMHGTRFAATNTELEKDVLPPAPMPWAHTQPSSVALLSTETASQISSTPTRTPVMSPSTPRSEKRPLHVVTNEDSIEMAHMLPSDAIQHRQEAAGSGSVYRPPQQQQMSSAGAPALGELVTGLSALLNTHLHQEYVQRERELDAGMGVPPEYRDE
ncbi:hypothetical protein CALVIDRAFT_341385 [Calocera viscosa TUFC12733]|uniref:Transmembrane protein n=1 Tax=Calocera viscosa (strain TUFC12733) TaxID=1330018 RepID=A0A167HEM1_CALVF|nr:hypothetical protein CALVIDRAFT_341385 [Calocera viscosa TUFC12733]